MGHARVDNISRCFNRLIRAKGKLTIRECVDELERTEQKVHASEGQLSERYMLALMAEQIVSVLYDRRAIEPLEMTRAQKRLFKQWSDPDGDGTSDWDSGEDGNGGKYALFDSIKWGPLKTRLPVIQNIES